MSTSAVSDADECNDSGVSAQRAGMEQTQIRPIIFAHHANKGATMDSICGCCFLVVARVLKESDLECLELRHVCQQVERRKSIRTAHRVFSYLY